MEKNISQEKRIEELEARLKEQEKLGSLGLLSAGIAHEIQNPLNFVHILSQPGKYIFDIFQFRFRNTSFCFIHPIGQVGQL